MLLLAEDYAAMGVSERTMFGNLIGRGEMGYIFDYTGNPNLVIKLVQIRPYVDGEVRPFRETFRHIRSSRAKKIAINELQANLFRKMEQSPASDHLPQIFEFSYGGVTLELREALKHSYQTYGWGEFGGYIKGYVSMTAAQALKHDGQSLIPYIINWRITHAVQFSE